MEAVTECRLWARLYHLTRDLTEGKYTSDTEAEEMLVEVESLVREISNADKPTWKELR